LHRESEKLDGGNEKMKIKPIGERVLVKQNKKEDKTAGGIYIPDSAKEERKEGVVVSAGQYKDGKELPLKEGDKVLYGGYSSEEVEIDGQKHVFVDFKDILAKIE
jgi:chaperonin GroES